MTPMHASSSDSSAPPRSRGIILLVAALTFWPFLAHLGEFRSLFYYQDEWDLLNWWDETGFKVWITTTFAENFVPLFKLAWGGAITAFNGSYFALLVVLWVNHALNAAMLAHIASRTSAGRWGGLLAGLVFGVAWINHETLTWTVQWSAVLSLSFLLIGICLLIRWERIGSPPAWRAGLLLALLVLGSGLCFSRGVLTGGAFAAWALFTPVYTRRWRRRCIVAALSLLPAFGVANWIFSHASGNHQHATDAIGPMFRFALHYYAQAPLRTLWSSDTPGQTAIVTLAVLKTALFVAGWLLAPRRMRTVLLALAAFEMGNALLLGLGRYHTGLPASGSSRYQYGALISLLPFIGVLFERAIRLLPERRGLQRAAAVAAIAVLTWVVKIPWTDTLAHWAPDRGRELRHALFVEPPTFDIRTNVQPAWMPSDRLRFLAAKHNLH